MNYRSLLTLLILFPIAVSAQHALTDKSDRGYYNRTGTDLLIGSENSTARYFMINGYRFNGNVSAGIGIGYVPYNDPLGVIPIFTDLSFFFSEGDVSPFLYLRMGYSLSTSADREIQMDSHQGGMMINPGIGFEFETSKSWGWYFNAGFNRDRTIYSYDTWGNQTVNNRYSYRRVNLGIGVVF